MIKPQGDLARKLDYFSHRQSGMAHANIKEEKNNLPALTSDDAITHRHLEARGDVGGKVLVSLLITIVLLDEVQVVTAKDDGALHLGRNNNTAQNATTDGNLKHATRQCSERN